MNINNQMLANAFRTKWEAKPEPKNIQDFLKSIPNAVNLKEDSEVQGVYSIQVMFSALDIKEVSSNGTDFLIIDLT